MELTCLAPKITSLKFLECSFLYAGVYCVSDAILLLSGAKCFHKSLRCSVCNAAISGTGEPCQDKRDFLPQLFVQPACETLHMAVSSLTMLLL